MLHAAEAPHAARRPVIVGKVPADICKLQHDISDCEDSEGH